MANITAKELSAIEDQLSMERLLVTKYRAVAGAVSDPSLKSRCEKIAGMHQEHYDRLLSHLN